MLNIGIEYALDSWKTCLIKDDQPQEFSTFTNPHATIAYVNSLCADKADALIALASQLESPFMPFDSIIQSFSMIEEQFPEVQIFLQAMKEPNLKGYQLPALKYLPQIPRYRRLKYHSLGTAGTLCSIATLCSRMRQQGAEWSEMSFLYIEVGSLTHSVAVIKEGSIIDGIGEVSIGYEDAVDEEDRAQAFWERLIQDVAGLFAVHHLEDIVIRDKHAANRTQRIIDRLGESYQLYLFPRVESEPEGFEAAMGAAILASSLSDHGLNAEVAGRLLSVVAEA